MPTTRQSRGPALLAWLLLAILTINAGCAGISLFGKETPPTTPAELQELRAKASEAWQLGKYDRTLQLYSLILAGENVPREAKLQALERYAKSALYLGRAPEALEGLENWAKFEPSARSSWDWTQLYVKALSQTGRDRQAQEYLARIIQTKGQPYDFTSRAGLELAKRYASQGLSSQAVQILRSERAKAPDRQAKATFEADLARMLGTMDAKSLAALLATVKDQNRLVFPYNLIAFEDQRRNTAANPANRPAMQDLVDRLAKSSDLADKGLPGRIMAQGLEAGLAAPAIEPPQAAAEPEAPPVKPGTVAVALLLPQTGQLRAIAAKVLAGAKAAQSLAAQSDIQVDLRVINTDDPGFVDQLTALPPEVMLVGGPMHATYFKSLPASGQLSKRIFLTFMPDLPDIQEGRDAWRFFWSPQDEVDSVLNLPLDAGVKHFAVLYPDDRMGKRLADLFSATASARNAQVTLSQAYPPQEAAKWGDLVKNMVRAVPQGQDGKTFSAKPDFQALYIPDQLQNADQLLGQLQFYQATQLIVLGSQLWSETLSQPGKHLGLPPAAYRFTFCPGAWWPENPAKSVAQLKEAMARDNQGEPDFWAALGFDFVRLAKGLGQLPVEVDPTEVNRRLSQAASQLEWTMAPLSWDDRGQAKMAMYFFRPSVEGLSPVDKAGFKERLNAAQGPAPQ
jgi:hypothetical protein